MLTSLLRRAAPRGARRLCSLPDDGAIASAVLKLGAEKGVSQPDAEFPSLDVKCRVLSACEQAFGMQMLHSDLSRVRSVQDASRYWCDRHEGERQRRRRDAEHWTVASPPNVIIDESHLLRKLLDREGPEAFRGEREEIEDELAEIDKLTPFLKRHGMPLHLSRKHLPLDDGDWDEDWDEPASGGFEEGNAPPA